MEFIAKLLCTITLWVLISCSDVSHGMMKSIAYNEIPIGCMVRCMVRKHLYSEYRLLIA